MCSSLAAEYGVDWLQIWATNPRMGNPDVIQWGENAKLINIGVLYKARQGETPAALAAKFYWDVETMISYNPQLTSVGASVEQVTLLTFSCVAMRRLLKTTTAFRPPRSLNPTSTPSWNLDVLGTNRHTESTHFPVIRRHGKTSPKSD